MYLYKFANFSFPDATWVYWQQEGAASHDEQIRPSFTSQAGPELAVKTWPELGAEPGICQGSYQKKYFEDDILLC